MVERYFPATHRDGGLCHKPNAMGEWVRHSDYEALEAERDDLAQRAAVIDEALTNAVQLRTAAEADKARLSEARDDWENEAGEFAKEVDRLKCVIEEMEQERNSFDTHMEAVKRKYRNRAIEAERAAHAALSGSGDGWEYRYNHMNTNKPVDWRDGKGEVFSVLPGYELRRKALPASPSTAGER